MPKNQDIKKVLVIGSGPIVIGQAAEFDYAGTQACRSLKEEGIEVVLLNSNPATIMTDKDIADRVYIEPLTVGGGGAADLKGDAGQRTADAGRPGGAESGHGAGGERLPGTSIMYELIGTTAETHQEGGGPAGV